MATTNSQILQTLSLRGVRNAPPISSKAHSPKPAPPSHSASLPGRRQLIFLFTAATTLKAIESPSRAQDIPLFGLRKNLKKAEEATEAIVKEGFETAEKGIEAAEKGIESAEKGIEAAEKGIEAVGREAESIETAVSFGGGLAQAGVVAGAEAFGVLVATSVVNGILGPEGQKS